MGKTLCQKEIPREQVEKLITDGKTDLIHRFISKKGRPFSAFLKLEKDKVSFEFEERERKPSAAKKTATRATKTTKVAKAPRAKKSSAAA